MLCVRTRDPEAKLDALTTLTMGTIVERFGLTILSVVGRPIDPHSPVNAVAFYDEHDLSALQPGSLVLGVGMDDVADISKALERLGGVAASGLVIPPGVRNPARIGRESPTALLELRREVSWMQLTTMLTAGLELSRRPTGGFEFSGDADSDLFEMANSLAGMLGGPVTIENMSSQILAFSADQALADEPRKQSVLGRQVSHKHNRVLAAQGVFREILDSSKPVYVPSIVEGSRPRMAMRIRAGSENLGSIWVIVDGPLSASRRQAFVEGANVVALTLVRRQITQDAGARLRAGLIAKLVEGGAPAVEAAEQSGMIGSRCFVMAIAGTAVSEHGSSQEAELESAARTLNGFLSVVDSRAICAPVGRTIYAVIPMQGRKRQEDNDATALGQECLKRIPGSDSFAVGVSEPINDITHLDEARRQADMALRVLRLPSMRARGQQVVGIREVRVESLLMRLADLMKAEPLEDEGALSVLREYDARHDAAMVDSLRAFLDSFGDVSAAANTVHVHPNTFRYRLKRMSEVAEIDLSDADTRFALMLQLRVLALSSPWPLVQSDQ